jgi:hypothetical protein
MSEIETSGASITRGESKARQGKLSLPSYPLHTFPRGVVVEYSFHLISSFAGALPPPDSY